jgi:hypothetical protein
VTLFWRLKPEGGWWTALWVFLSADLFVLVGWLVNLVLRRTIFKPVPTHSLSMPPERGGED